MSRPAHLLALAVLGSIAPFVEACGAPASPTPPPERGFVTAVPAPVAAPARRPPSIVFLLADDQTAFDVGAYGNASVHTPNVDALARAGMRFDAAFVTSPQCSPSRASILTSRSPVAVGASRLHAPLRDTIPSILEPLKKAGYWVTATRKVHLGEAFQRRWDYYGGFDSPPSEPLAHRPKDKPFFFWVGLEDPHRPYPHGTQVMATDPKTVVVPPWLPDTPLVRKDLAMYDDAIARMDRDAGDVLAALDREGLSDDTIVVFAADNGMPFPGAKGSLWDPGIHVPLVVRWPGHVAPGSVDTDLVSLVDLGATWLDVAHAAPPPRMEGRSFLGRLDGSHPGPTRKAIYAERDWHDTQDIGRVVRTDRYAFIVNARPEVAYLTTDDLRDSLSWTSMLDEDKRRALPPYVHSRLFVAPRPSRELYDLSADPLETKNLAGTASLAGETKELEGMLGAWQEAVNDYVVPIARSPLGRNGTSGDDPIP